eukprot:1383634-Rhodomonas_salina.1
MAERRRLGHDLHVPERKKLPRDPRGEVRYPLRAESATSYAVAVLCMVLIWARLSSRGARTTFVRGPSG